LISVHPERFPLGILKRLHTRCRGLYKVLRRFGSSTYELNIPCNLGISPIFSVENLTCYRTFMGPQRFLVHPLQPPLRSLCSLFQFEFIIHAVVICQWRIFQSQGQLIGITSFIFYVALLFFILCQAHFSSFVLISCRV